MKIHGFATSVGFPPHPEKATPARAGMSRALQTSGARSVSMTWVLSRGAGFTPHQKAIRLRRINPWMSGLTRAAKAQKSRASARGAGFTPLPEGHSPEADKSTDDRSLKTRNEWPKGHPRRYVGVITGFTLLETLIVIAIFSVASIIATSIFFGHSNLFRFSTASVNTGSGARLAADRIAATVREANAVLSSYDFSGTTHLSGPDKLVLTLRTVDASSNVVNNAYDYVAFYRSLSDSTKLLETTLANVASRRSSGTRVVTDRLSDLTFSYDNVSFPAVRTVTLEIKTAESFRNSSATSTVRLLAKLRNKN